MKTYRIYSKSAETPARLIKNAMIGQHEMFRIFPISSNIPTEALQHLRLAYGDHSLSNTYVLQLFNEF